MTKTLIALAAAGSLAIAAVAAPQPAEARGGAVAAGVIGGLAAGALIGSAAAGAYGPGYGYYGYGPGPYYGAYDAGYGGECVIRRERFWDGFGWRIRRVRVCY